MATLWTLALGWPGGWELVVVAAVLLVLFYSRRLPEIARSLGKGITEFRRGLSEPSDKTPAQLEKDRKQSSD